MSTVMTTQKIALSMAAWLAAAGMAAAQQPPRPPRPVRPVPAPRAPAAPAAPAAPLTPFSFDTQLPPVPPGPPAPFVVPDPPSPPDFGPFDFNIDVDAIRELTLQSVNVDALRQSARRAMETARDSLAAIGADGPFVFDLPNLAANLSMQDGIGRGIGVGIGRGGRIGRGDDGLPRSESQADALYSQARGSIDAGRYERAIELLDRLASPGNTYRVDAALYWKSYTLAKVGKRDDALTTIADMQKRFADSRWLKDAKALAVEIQQAAGRPVSPDSQNDEEIKLLALRGLMQSDPDRAVPMIEKLLAGNSSIRLQENALFVLSQSRSAKAREIIASVAKTGNPDLQLRAIRYLGAAGGTDNRQLLDEVYRTSNDIAVKRAILRSLMTSGDRPRLLSIAKSDSSAEIRGEAVQQLANMRASAELSELYQSESSPEVKRRILMGMAAAGTSDRLIDLARTEKDLELRRTVLRSLGGMTGSRNDTDARRVADALKALYTSESDVQMKREMLNAMSAPQNAQLLVDLARAEKDPSLKREIVQRLSNMKSKEAADYLLELLK